MAAALPSIRAQQALPDRRLGRGGGSHMFLSTNPTGTQDIWQAGAGGHRRWRHDGLRAGNGLLLGNGAVIEARGGNGATFSLYGTEGLPLPGGGGSGGCVLRSRGVRWSAPPLQRVACRPPIAAMLLFPPRAAFCLVLLAACSSSPSAAPGVLGFDHDLTGWRADHTGGSGPASPWVQRADAAAPSPPNVVAVQPQNVITDERFNLFWTSAVRFRDGRLAVAARADQGTIDQGGGPIWRAQDADNYYICRFNPLEDNYRVYVVKDGVRRQLASAEVVALAGQWHRLEVEHVGDRITCWLNGARLLEVTDATIPGEGGVGLWTKADAATSFDDLVVSAAK